MVTVVPIYTGLSHITGQIGGLLLLSMHRENHDLHLDHKLYRDPRDRLSEIEGNLDTISPPKEAKLHFWAIVKAVGTLRQAIDRMERIAATKDAERCDQITADLIRRLHKVHALLRFTANPDAGLTSTDFDNTCCNCTGHAHHHESIKLGVHT